MGVTAAIVATVGTVSSAVNQHKAAQEQKQALRLQRRQTEIANARQRRKAVADANAKRAQLRAESATTGVQGSSGVQGADASITSQLAEQLGTSLQQDIFGNQITQANQSAAQATGQAGIASAIAAVPAAVGFTPSFGEVLKDKTSSSFDPNA